MNKRQKEIQQLFLNNEKAVLKKLENNYSDALDEINSKIELLMARQDADMQHVIYQVEYQKALKTQVQSILEQLQGKEFETLSEYLTKSYEDGFIGTMYDLQGQGIPLVFPIDQEQVLNAIQTETKLSEPLYTALGKDLKELQRKISGEISRGLSSGQMYTEIARNVANWARIPKNNAMRIARTEAHRIQTKAAMDACEKAKDKGADVVKQWDASLDRNTRENHRSVDGQIRELDEPFSNGMMYPGDPSGGASEVINCRCALLQRARWALDNDSTKWDEEEGIIPIDAKNYQDYHNKYRKHSERVRSNAQKIKGKDTLEKNGKSDKMKSPLLDLNLQLFASGKDRLLRFGSNWKSASLTDAVSQYVPNASVKIVREKNKIIYSSDDSKYSVVYDYDGHYFRIEDTTQKGKRRYVDIGGNDMKNVTVNGKTRGRTKDEYESLTHFKNSDEEGTP